MIVINLPIWPLLHEKMNKYLDRRNNEKYVKNFDSKCVLKENWSILKFEIWTEMANVSWNTNCLTKITENFYENLEKKKKSGSWTTLVGSAQPFWWTENFENFLNIKPAGYYTFLTLIFLTTNVLALKFLILKFLTIDILTLIF